MVMFYYDKMAQGDRSVTLRTKGRIVRLGIAIVKPGYSLLSKRDDWKSYVPDLDLRMFRCGAEASIAYHVPSQRRPVLKLRNMTDDTTLITQQKANHL